jgi:hypothetical protein
MQLPDNIKSEIADRVQSILQRNHKSSEKARLKQMHQRLNFACPYCGDSTDDDRKKRGNLYWESLSFHCFNCSKHRDADSFLRDFEEGFDGEMRIELVKLVRERKKYEIASGTIKFDLFLQLDNLSIAKEEIFNYLNVYPINENTKRAHAYLRSRMLISHTERFGFDPRKNMLYVFNLDTSCERVIGYQVRNLGDGDAKYLSYNIERMYKRLNKTLELLPEKMDSLNKISMLFGILHLDFARDFTVFEGPIDAMFMKNSIGLTGVKKNVDDFDELDSVRYFFDNDYEGKKKIMEKMKLHKKGFMWKKYIADNRLTRHKIKDLNDLVKVAYKEGNIAIINNINLYFSDNPRDIIYV